MEVIARNGKNFAELIKREGASLKFEANGREFKVLRYFKSQPKTPEELAGRPLAGNQTQVIIKWKGGKEEAFVTAVLREQNCPEYTTTPHKEPRPSQTFVMKGLEFATDAELLQAREAITECLRKRDEERKAQKDKEIKSALNALQGLSKEEILKLLNK